MSDQILLKMGKGNKSAHTLFFSELIAMILNE